MNKLDRQLSDLRDAPLPAGLTAIDQRVFEGIASRREAGVARKGLILAGAFSLVIGVSASLVPVTEAQAEPLLVVPGASPLAAAGGYDGQQRTLPSGCAGGCGRGAGGVVGFAQPAGIARSRQAANSTDIMHQELDLDARQEAGVEALEKSFAGRRKELEAKLRQANAELARAMSTEHQYGPRVTTAVDHAHMAMGDLQKATLEHVFAMRALLRPDQAARFDRAVDKALTGTGGE